jgi:hypothetical protein
MVALLPSFDIWCFINMMNNWRKIIACRVLLALAALFISSCGDWDFESGNSGKYFTSDLRGTWVSTDKSIYSGELVIEIDRITIYGFFEGQTPPVGGNDNRRPFKNFTKGVALKGYSEDSKIFIEDRGLVQEGIPYTYVSNSLEQINLIHFNFGGRTETMKRQR